MISGEALQVLPIASQGKDAVIARQLLAVLPWWLLVSLLGDSVACTPCWSGNGFVKHQERPVTSFLSFEKGKMTLGVRTYLT